VAVLNTIELEGVSSEGWREAANEALTEAARTLRSIRRMDVLGTSAIVQDGQITEYRAQVRLTFEVNR
jgi:dodecin